MEKEQQKTKGQAFVDYVLGRLENDRGMGARLRRADNPDLEYQSWEYLAGCGVNLENASERKAFALVGAALARDKPKANGRMRMGKAISHAYDDDPKNDQAKAKLRRLLACSSTDEACGILRPLLRLVASRGATLNYTQLLMDLIYFSEKVKVDWANDFFNTSEPSKNAESSAPQGGE